MFSHGADMATLGRALVHELVLPAGVARGGAPSPVGEAAFAGRLVEISSTLAHAPWSYAAAMVVRAQARGEACAWVQPAAGELYPPDLAAAGVVLADLVVARVPASAGAFGLPRAAEILLASGALGLLVLDALLAPVPPHASWQRRLLSLARAASSTVLVLTDKAASAPSLGALCGWRLEPHRQLTAADDFLLAPHWLRHRSCAGWPAMAGPAVAPWRRPQEMPATACDLLEAGR